MGSTILISSPMLQNLYPNFILATKVLSYPTAATMQHLLTLVISVLNNAMLEN